MFPLISHVSEQTDKPPEQTGNTSKDSKDKEQKHIGLIDLQFIGFYFMRCIDFLARSLKRIKVMTYCNSRSLINRKEVLISTTEIKLNNKH